MATPGTVIGQGITIEGEISLDEPVHVAGTVRGKLTVEGAVTVEEGAVVEADIGATTLSVAGNVIGNVSATDRVDLLAGGRLVGDVRAARVTIAEVEELVEPGVLDPDTVHLPGVFVQRVYQGSGYEKRIERRTVQKG